MKIICSCCAKQAVSYSVARDDKHCTIMQGARYHFGNTIICGYCAEDLENGLFPEEQADVQSCILGHSQRL